MGYGRVRRPGGARQLTNQDEAERIRRDLIEKRAYEIYQARGSHHGFDQEDWEQAEREVDGLQIDDDQLPDREDEEAADEQTRTI
jgi:dienelactone hydrolase